MDMKKTGTKNRIFTVLLTFIMVIGIIPFNTTVIAYAASQSFPFTENVTNSSYVKNAEFTITKNGYYEIKTTGKEMYVEVFKQITYGGGAPETVPVLSSKGISLKNIWSGDLDAGSYTLKIVPVNKATTGTYTCALIENEHLLTKSNVTQHNKPVLAVGMTPIYWTENQNIQTVINLNNATEYSKWFNYEKGVNRWANIRIADGSMFVWIPRFAYNVGDVFALDTKFLNGTSNTAFDGTVCKKVNANGITATDYIVHPAFTAGGV